MTLLSKRNNPDVTCIPWYYHKYSIWNPPTCPTCPDSTTPHPCELHRGELRKGCCQRGVWNVICVSLLAAVSCFSGSLLKLLKSEGRDHWRRSPRKEGGREPGSAQARRPRHGTNSPRGLPCPPLCPQPKLCLHVLLSLRSWCDAKGFCLPLWLPSPSLCV